MLRLTLFAYLVTAHAYLWPSPELDALESTRFELDQGLIARFVTPCDSFIKVQGLVTQGECDNLTSAGVQRLATHNAADGTGGMDASIRFSEEQAHPENVGDGFANTVGLLARSSNRYVSVADTLALGPIIAIESCGGPQIAFRGGRVDATEPDLPGVPELEQSLDSHIASFARAGFTQEMIGLVAYGHTFGGVQHAPFPDIVPELNDPNSTESVVHFDTTNTNFDNNLAAEYIAGTTQNPLVVGFNDTTNSDKRIFGSDGNATMLSFCGMTTSEVFTTSPFPPRATVSNNGLTTFYPIITADGASFLSLDAAAGITSIRFLVDGKLEDQGGVGFAVLDAIAFSTAMYVTEADSRDFPVALQYHIAVRSGVNATRTYIEEEEQDSTGHVSLNETELIPVQPLDANATYTIWTVNTTAPDISARYVGAEIDGVKISTGAIPVEFHPPCLGS
ncbi:heme peroxidase [Mycena leptocephala]|nr:heme peroxidase [Mycena leptocephala]